MSAREQEDPPAPRRYRGPQGLGEEASRALEEGSRASEGFGGLEEEALLRAWFADQGALIPEPKWRTHPLVTKHTAEHEVRYRAEDHVALKRTWPGTFGMIPREVAGHWEPRSATPGEYLVRQALQNELFGDDIKLEGAMTHDGWVVLDAKPDNFITTVEGILPIDLLLGELPAIP